MKVADVLKTDGILKILASDTLGKALNMLSSSHDAAFVFKDGEFKEYIGVVNPYYCVIKTQHPPETKVENVIFHAPKLKKEDLLERAARLMIESKIHYLPVLDQKARFLGIVTARRILGKLLEQGKLEKPIHSVLGSKKPLVKVKETDSIFEVLEKFKSERVSKLVVVDDHDHLRGIVAHYDLIGPNLFPKTRISYGDKAGDKASNVGKVRNLMKTYVLTLKIEDMLSDAARLILDKEIGSVVIVDKERRPISIITTTDLLKKAFEMVEVKQAEAELKNLREKYIGPAKRFVDKIIKKARKRGADVKIWIEEGRSGGVVKIKVEVKMKGQVYHFAKEDKNLKRLFEKINSALEELF